jgi:hypothetical protein
MGIHIERSIDYDTNNTYFEFQTYTPHQSPTERERERERENVDESTIQKTTRSTFVTAISRES